MSDGEELLAASADRLFHDAWHALIELDYWREQNKGDLDKDIVAFRRFADDIERATKAYTQVFTFVRNEPKPGRLNS